MFAQTKNVVCIVFSKTGVLCALAQIAGRKVEILSVDHINIESGILEEGIIYDIPHLQQIVKNLITSVSRNQNRIDSAWIALPDSKIKIIKFEVDKDKKGIDEYQLHRIVEERFSQSASKLNLINKPIHEINNKVFFLSSAIRNEHLHPYQEVFEPVSIPVEGVFPTFQCIFEELKDLIQVPTLLLYPQGKNYKFLIADSNGVHLESVYGHNVIENNEHLDKAVNEVIEFAKQSKEVAIGVKKVMAIESKDIDSESLQIHMRRAGLDFAWIPSQANSNLDPISIIILKGLIKCSMSQKLNKGFLEPQITHTEDLPTPAFFAQQKNINNNVNQGSYFSLNKREETSRTQQNGYIATPTRNTLFKKSSNILEERWNLKVISVSVILALALVGTIVYAGWMIAQRVTENTNPTARVSTTPSPTASEVPTATSTPIPTATATPEPTATPTNAVTPAVSKQDVYVLVLNGNNVAGQAREVAAKLKASGFKTRDPGNNPQKNIPTTTVYYKNQGYKALADEAAKVIEPNYPSAKSTLDTTIQDDIVVILGIR